MKEREFVEAARSMGASGPRIMFKHLIPNSLGPIMVALSLSVVGRDPRRVDAVVLRLRAQPGEGQATWGLLIAEAPESILPGYWWMVVVPVPRRS